MTNIKTWFSGRIEKTFSDKKKTFKFLALFVFTILFLLEAGMILFNNSFYNNASDDVLQYYTIIVDFISGLKDGTVSWFNLNNYFGASLFSDVYYVPIDIFTGITFLFSYVMPTEVAYSITEFVKIFAGVMMFAYYLSLKGMKNRTIFWMGAIYFIAGGTISFMAFPVFLSLTFYMPVALVVIHFFFHKKRWIVPLFAMASIFYDFYLGYTLLAFSCFAFLIEYFKEPDFKFFKFIKEGAIFVVLLLLGVVMAGIIAYPSIVYILEETDRVTVQFDPWIINVFGHQLKLFQPNIYIRYLAKIFVEQKPIGFYGFENDYTIEHVSLYISVIGFAYMSYVWFMKDKISRVYKIAMLFAIVFMIFPIFSYVFSGTTDRPYTRWINMLPIFEIMILAHIFDKHGFEKVKMSFMSIIIGLMLAAIGGLMYYYISQLQQDYYLASRDVLTADTYLMGAAALFLVVLLIFGWLKKWTVVKAFFWIEFIVAIIYAYSGPMSVVNKIDTFQNAHDIEHYLDSVIDDDQFYRVYVDINNLGVEDTNFNRMTGYATNTGIFHSWTDKETNDIAYLLFNQHEYQSKKAMNTFDYYLSHFLGYKYILVDSTSNYAFDNQHFKIVAINEHYKLYELLDATPFKVYESFLTYTDFRNYNVVNSDMATEKVLLMSAVIDSDRYVTDQLNLDYSVPATEGNGNFISSYRTFYGAVDVQTSGIQDTTERLFYKYPNDLLDISFDMGAVYIKSATLSTSSYGEVFMEFADESRSACTIQPGQSHQVKCEFWKQPTAIYVEDTEFMNSSPALQVRQERAIDRAAYLVYDLSQLNIDSSSGIIDFAMNASFGFEGRTFVVDEFGNQYECIDGFYSFDTKPDKLYVYKTSKMYEYSNLFNLSVRFSYDDLTDSNSLLNRDYVSQPYLTIQHGTIHLSYTNTSTSTTDQLVMIPVAFSDDWIITSPTPYQTMSTSGGFLGIMIPNGTSQIDVTLKFKPKGLGLGALITLGGLIVYTGIFLPAWLKKEKIGDDIQ